MEIIHAKFIWVMYLLKEYIAVYVSTCTKELTVNVVVDRLIHGQMFAATLPSRPQAWSWLPPSK